MVILCNKLVGVVLLLGMLAAPAAALSNCWTGSRNVFHHGCPPECAMMAKTVAAPVTTAQAQPEGSNCCRISSSKPAPISQSVAPSGQYSVAPPATQTTVAPDGIAPTAIRSSDTAPPPAVAPSQSVLCTFLI